MYISQTMHRSHSPQSFPPKSTHTPPPPPLHPHARRHPPHPPLLHRGPQLPHQLRGWSIRPLLLPTSGPFGRRLLPSLGGRSPLRPTSWSSVAGILRKMGRCRHETVIAAGRTGRRLGGGGGRGTDERNVQLGRSAAGAADPWAGDAGGGSGSGQLLSGICEFRSVFCGEKGGMAYLLLSPHSPGQGARRRPLPRSQLPL